MEVDEFRQNAFNQCGGSCEYPKMASVQKDLSKLKSCMKNQWIVRGGGGQMTSNGPNFLWLLFITFVHRKKEEWKSQTKYITDK